jgi:hypothetical protein
MKVVRIGFIAAFGLIGWTASAAVGAAPAFASCGSPISPGTNTCAPDQLTVSPSATVFDSKSGTITASPPTFTADWTETVYKDPGNTLCSSPGNCLTWVVKITGHIPSGSTDVIERVTISNFAGFIVNLGYINPPNTAPGQTNTGTQIPPNVERSTNGSILTWDFNTATSEIRDGQSTVLLEAMTNSTQIVPGTISVQDGAAGGGIADGPALPEIPWVPVLGLFGGALAGGVLYRRGRRVSG